MLILVSYSFSPCDVYSNDPKTSKEGSKGKGREKGREGREGRKTERGKERREEGIKERRKGEGKGREGKR